MFIKRGATSGDNPKIFRNFIPHEFIRLTKPSEMRIFIQAVFTLVLMVAVLHNFTVSSRNKWISCCHTVLLECQRSLFFIYIFRGFLMHFCTLSILSLDERRISWKEQQRVAIKIFLRAKTENGTSCYPNEFYRVSISAPRICGPIPSVLFLITCFNELPGARM